MQTLIAPAINLFILIGLLVYYLRQPLREFAETRSHTIAEELRTAQARLAEATQKHAEFTSKLKAMDAEITGLRSQAAQEAKELRARIEAEAQKMAGNIISDARTTAVILYSEFKEQLQSELGARVIDRAEHLLRERLTGDDRARITQEFAHQLEAAK